MSGITRLSVSLDNELVKQFDRRIAEDGCPTRSKAIGDLIRESLVRQEWKENAEVAGAIVLVYDHHIRTVTRTLTAIQHDHHGLILATQHVHLDHDNCLEILAVRGRPSAIAAIVKRLRAVKGIKHCALSGATTGQSLS